jgi:ABC-type glycerol-3-phosphate transport system substrate-binding protein
MKKVFSVFLAAVLLIAAFSSTVVAQDSSTTLLWGMWGSPEEIATHQKVADAYMKANPNVKVEIWSQPWGDYFTKLDTLFAAGDANAIPDVFFMSPVQNYAAKGLIQNLDPYIKKSGMDMKDYWPGALESTSYNGSVYGFPRDSAVEVLYYNKDDFDKAGLKYPDENWTWDDLRKAAEALTVKDASGRVSRYGLAAEGGKYFDFVGANGGAILDDMFKPTECKLSDPKSIAAIEYFSGLMNDGYAWRDANLSQAGGDQSVFLADQASMFIQNASRVPALNTAGINYDVAPTPKAPSGGRQSGSTNGAAWVMSAKTTKADAAWDFIQFLQSPEGGAAVYFAAGDAFPPTRSSANSSVFLDKTRKPDNKQAWLIGAESAPPNQNGWFPEWGELSSTIISPVLTSIWAGDAKPADVLPGLCDDVNTYLQDHGYGKKS